MDGDEFVRGQTTLDFALGASVFLAVVVVTFTFVPGILSPFDLTGEEEPALSNQIADSLSQDLLGSPAEPHALDRYCTVEFFDDEDNPPPECAYDSTAIEKQFNLGPTQHVNVSLAADVSGNGEATQLCWEPESENEIDLEDDWGLQEQSECADGTVLATGEPIPEDGVSTITARRVVFVHDRPVTMEVVVW